ncbi:unnamed protein product [Paramecium pentaurelia]|uniref:Uncharacterized protein n=1 Tax=Paramecium pentaurelia TaxID=43138 RepID=A0A8S1S5T5_9CILI|nr:unnamed protein product [Paramecium pentaurelia]
MSNKLNLNQLMIQINRLHHVMQQYLIKWINMISTFSNDIKIWNFDQGIFKLTTSYQKHTALVICLVYSKHNNYFISGSHDQTIVCWQQINQEEWICSKPYLKNDQFVNCLMLNKQEDQLNSLDKHGNSVESFSFNQSESLMASCGYGEFIIWRKELKINGNQNQQLNYYIYSFINFFLFRIQLFKDITNQIITTFNFIINNSGSLISGHKIQFTNDQQLFWVPLHKYIIDLLVFELEFMNKILIKQSHQLGIMIVMINLIFQQYIIRIEIQYWFDTNVKFI